MGSDVGPLFQAIMVNRCPPPRWRPFFYLNESLNAEEKSSGGGRRVGEGDPGAHGGFEGWLAIQCAFYGQRLGTGSADTPTARPRPGIFVQLVNEDGDVVDQHTTDTKGHNPLFHEHSGGSRRHDHPGISSTGITTVSSFSQGATVSARQALSFAIANRRHQTSGA